MHALSVVLTIAAATFAAAVGGVYIAFSALVLPALRDNSDAITVMRRVNVVAVRAPFMFVFFGSALTAAAVLVVELVTGAHPLVVVGAVLALASFAVTVVRNVPLNNELAGPTGDWQRFEPRWRRANHLRAALAIGAAVALITSLADFG